MYDGTASHLELTAYEVHPGSCPAVGDLDGDGLPEIVVDKRLSSGSITAALNGLICGGVD
jgi:hypothetical protein